MFIWLLIAALLSIIFFCTLGSTALNSIPPERLWRLKEAGGRTGACVEYWVAHSQQITWSFRVASRISSVGIALLLVTAFAGEALPVYAYVIAFLVTVVLVVFPGSLLPSAWAQLAGERVGLSILPLVRVIGFFLTPLSTAFQHALNAMLKLFGRPPVSFKPLRLRSEFEQCVGGIDGAGKLTEDERKMLRRVFAFGDLEARQVMTPQVAVRSLPEDEALEGAVRYIAKEHFSRIPVFRGNRDSIVGVLYAKDLLGKHGEPGAESLTVGGLAREPFFVPEAARIRAILPEMRRRRVHMAIVVDEYGAARGLITMEDIVEQIVGEIRDEYDGAEERLYEKVGEGFYRIEGRLSINDARQELGLRIPDSPDYDTIAGFVCAAFGKVPAAGEAIDWRGHTIRVLDATTTGVVRVEVRAPKK